LARTQPYYDRNKPHICSFWVKGECKRGEECPYRHEKPTDPDNPLSDQNIKDRYYGSKDPVADKLLNRAKALPVLKPPEDKTITTLYVGNLGDDSDVTESDIRDYFYQFGEIRNVTLLSGKGCGFVQFTTRESAELATEKTFNKLVLKGRRITIRWGRPQAQQNVASQLGGGGRTQRQFDPVPGLPGALPSVDFFNLDSDAPQPKRGRTDYGGASSATSATSATSSHQHFTSPMPPRLFAPGMRPGPLIVPKVPYIPPISNQATSRPSAEPSTLSETSSTTTSHESRKSAIYYPSQDPQHLGAKDLAD